MVQQKPEKLRTLHQWITVYAIPPMLALIIYFLVKVDKNVDKAVEAVIQHEQQIKMHEKEIDQLQQFVFRSR